MNSRRRYTLADRMLWAACRMVAVTPYWFRFHVLHAIVLFVFRYLLRYRRKLIIRQLSDSFPEKGASEITELCNRYYSTLAEMVVNTISMAGLDDVTRESLVTIHGKGCVCGCDMGKDVVVLTSHLGFWEYYTFPAIRMRRTHDLQVAYHPIRNRLINTFFRRIRSMDCCTPVASDRILRSFMNHSHEGGERHLILGLVSDQNAAPHSDSPHWFRFLNHDTIFFNGGERIAMKYRLPVFYLDMERVRKGYYRCTYTMIYDGVEEVCENEITERYVRHLEDSIRRNPDMWMWSHNRWKYYHEQGSTFPLRVAYSASRVRREARRHAQGKR